MCVCLHATDKYRERGRRRVRERGEKKIVTLTLRQEGWADSRNKLTTEQGKVEGRELTWSMTETWTQVCNRMVSSNLDFVTDS